MTDTCPKGLKWGAEGKRWKFWVGGEYVFLFLGRRHVVALTFERGGAETWAIPRIEAWTRAPFWHAFRVGWRLSALGLIWDARSKA